MTTFQDKLKQFDLERQRKAAGEGSAPMIETKDNDLVVVASDPQELVNSQHALIASVASKIDAARADVKEAEELIAAAKMAAIDDTAAKRLLKREQHRLMYLEKVKAALEAGYILMPNIPGDVMAIRVQRKSPEQGPQYAVPANQLVRPVSEVPDALPAGEGRYVKPVPDAEVRQNWQSKPDRPLSDLTIRGFDEDIALPVEFLKPTVVKRTGEALELKVFDEIVLVHNGQTGDSRGAIRTRKGDPLVIGRIFDVGAGRKVWQRRRVLSFLIAWFVDTKAI